MFKTARLPVPIPRKKNRSPKPTLESGGQTPAQPTSAKGGESILPLPDAKKNTEGQASPPVAPLSESNNLGKLDPPPGVTLPPPGISSSLAELNPNQTKKQKSKLPKRADDPNKDDDFPSPIKQAGHAEDEKKTPPPPPDDPPMLTLPAPSGNLPTPTAPKLDLPKPGVDDPPLPVPGVGKLDVPKSPMAAADSPKLLPPGAPALSPPASESQGPPKLDLAPLPGTTPPDQGKDPSSLPKIGADAPRLSPMITGLEPPPVIKRKTDEKNGDIPPKKLAVPSKLNGGGSKLVELPKPDDKNLKPLDPPKTGEANPKPMLNPPMPMGNRPKPTLDLPKPPDDTLKPKLEKPNGGLAGPKPPTEIPSSIGGPNPPKDFGASPSIARPLEPQPEASVNSYDEEWHYCKQQGETLEAISQKYYFTPKYEQALRQYQLDRNFAPIFQQEKASLSLGQVVKVPPARILEHLYPTSVNGGRASAPVRPASVGGSTAPAASLGPVGAKELGGPREYTVPHDGMTLKDVARDELGNESQWHRIFLLNRWVNPSAPLPTGAKLFLPRRARSEVNGVRHGLDPARSRLRAFHPGRVRPIWTSTQRR